MSDMSDGEAVLFDPTTPKATYLACDAEDAILNLEDWV